MSFHRGDDTSHMGGVARDRNGLYSDRAFRIGTTEGIHVVTCPQWYFCGGHFRSICSRQRLWEGWIQ